MKRRGVILVEAIAACGLLLVLLALCVQLLALTTLERRYTEHRAIALQEAANLAERAAALSYDDLNNEQLAQLQVSPDVAAILPGAKATLTLDEEAGDLPAKRVQLALQWQGKGKQPEPPVRLTWWAYAPQSDVAEPDAADDPPAGDPPASDAQPVEDAS